MSLRYRRFDDGLPPAGSARYATIAGVLALAPLGALVDRVAGAGDILHTVAHRPADE